MSHVAARGSEKRPLDERWLQRSTLRASSGAMRCSLCTIREIRKNGARIDTYQWLVARILAIGLYNYLKNFCGFEGIMWRSVQFSLLLVFFSFTAFAADQTGVTNDTIKIGIFGPLTGPAGLYRKGVYGAAAIYKNINDKGGINGRKFELIIEDDACDPNKGIAAVKKLISQDEVFLLHGGMCSGVVLAVKPQIAAKPTLPFLILGAGSTHISTPVVPNLFHPVLTSQVISDQMVEFALSKPGAKRIAIVRHTDEWGTSYFEPAIAALKARGLDPVHVANFERGSTDATAQVLAIKNAEPDAVLAFLYPTEIAIYLREAYKYRLRTTTLATHAVSIDDADKQVGIPAALNDLYVAYPLAGPITGPELSIYLGLLKKYYPSESVDTLAMFPMAGAIVVVEALKRLGPNVSRERFIAELNKLNNFDSGVLSGRITFSPNDHAGIKEVKMISLYKRKTVLLSKYPPPPDR
jgi:branched-chain amino acid transport system substrate-binding protein